MHLGAARGHGEEGGGLAFPFPQVDGHVGERNGGGCGFLTGTSSGEGSDGGDDRGEDVLGGGDPVLQGLLPGSKDEAGGVAFSFPRSNGVGEGSNGGEELLNRRPWLRSSEIQKRTGDSERNLRRSGR